jgi:rhamnogalacturonan endolyase
VGLAQPEPGGNWQFESKRYEYWAKAARHGDFIIAKCPSGNLHALRLHRRRGRGIFKTGCHGHDREDEAGEPDRGTFRTRGSHIAWEIGVPDRTAKEFVHGDNYFHGYVWTNFANEFPNPLDYYVGKSDWRTVWNYAQTRYAKSGPSGYQCRAVEMAESTSIWTAFPHGAATLTLGHRQRATGAD